MTGTEPPPNPDGGTAPPPNGFGLDFTPTCEDESATALTADGLCMYPLPADLEVMSELTSIALVSGGEFTLVARVDGPRSCELLTGGFYFTASEPPHIALCPQTCLRAGAAAEMQVVLVSCPPAP